jgi:hypothetical protein
LPFSLSSLPFYIGRRSIYYLELLFFLLASLLTWKPFRVSSSVDAFSRWQVGSHFHFAETNPYLKFDRALAFGKRLNVPAGTAVRFEPGDIKKVSLVEIAGNKASPSYLLLWCVSTENAMRKCHPLP